MGELRLFFSSEGPPPKSWRGGRGGEKLLVIGPWMLAAGRMQPESAAAKREDRWTQPGFSPHREPLFHTIQETRRLYSATLYHRGKYHTLSQDTFHIRL